MTLERETLHVMDDKQRIALVETRTHGNDPSPQQLIRYQFGNHLGSASLELDGQAKIISYEEYYPYGSTSYQAVSSQTETSKRYRYTGKERDEESGLYYYGARYYAAWLGRWTKSDPIDIQDSPNLYVFVKGNPLRFYDPDGAQVDTVDTLEELVIDIPAPSSTLKGQQAEAAAQMTKARELGDQDMYDFYFHRVLDLQRKIDPIGVASAAVVGTAIVGPFAIGLVAHFSVITVAPEALAIGKAASTAAILGVKTGITAAAMSFVGTVGVETTADLGIAAYGALTGDPVLAGVGALDAVSGPTPLAEGAALARLGKRGGTSSQGASTKGLPSGQGPRPLTLASNKRRSWRGHERESIYNKRQNLRGTSLDMEIGLSRISRSGHEILSLVNTIIPHQENKSRNLTLETVTRCSSYSGKSWRVGNRHTG